MYVFDTKNNDAGFDVPTMLVQVPVGIEPGGMLMVPLPDGTQMQVQVPPGIGPDGMIRVPYAQSEPSTMTPADALTASFTHEEYATATHAAGSDVTGDEAGREEKGGEVVGE